MSIIKVEFTYSLSKKSLGAYTGGATVIKVDQMLILQNIE